jgi:hypothetical protein
MQNNFSSWMASNRQATGLQGHASAAVPQSGGIHALAITAGTQDSQDTHELVGCHCCTVLQQQSPYTLQGGV